MSYRTVLASNLPGQFSDATARGHLLFTDWPGRITGAHVSTSGRIVVSFTNDYHTEWSTVFERNSKLNVRTVTPDPVGDFDEWLSSRVLDSTGQDRHIYQVVQRYYKRDVLDRIVR